MKEKKENQIPSTMLNEEPVKKLGKLVLPKPQISDEVEYWYINK